MLILGKPDYGRYSGGCNALVLFDSCIATAGQIKFYPIRVIAVGSQADANAIARALLNKGFYTLATSFPAGAQGLAGIRCALQLSISPST